MIKQVTGNSIIGVVMCGGLSTRMFSDKGLLKHNNLLWCEITKKILDNITDKTVISINQNQLIKYKTIFPHNQLIVDSTNVNGPLKGILSVHSIFPNNDLFILACDMINMQISTIKFLYDNSKEGTFDFYVYNNNEKLEPLCAIYSARGLKIIKALLSNGKIKEYSLKYILSIGKTKAIRLNKNIKNQFINFNSPNDIKNQQQNKY